MGPIPPPSNRNRGEYHPIPPSKSLDINKQFQKEREDIETNALQIIFTLMEENGTGGSGTDDQGKIKKIINQAAAGHLSPTEAAAEILTVVTQMHRGAIGKHRSHHHPIPHVRINAAQKNLATNVSLFSLFLSETIMNKTSLSPHFEKAAALADKIEEGSIPVKEGLTQLNQMIDRINSSLPASKRYPTGLTEEMFE